MNSFWIVRGETGDIILRTTILDSSVSTGAGLTGISYTSSGLVIAVTPSNAASPTVYSQAGGTLEDITTLGTFAAPTATKCRVKQLSATYHPGVIEIQLPVSIWATSGARYVVITISGVTNMAPRTFAVPLTQLNPEVLQAPASTALSTATWTNTLATDLGTTNSTVVTNLNATISSRLSSGDYTAPPSASTISTQVASDLLSAHGSGSWTTATGFATPTNVTDAVTSIKGADGDTLETLSDQIDGIDGGGGGDATLAKQVEILTAIQGSEVIQVASPNVSGNLVLTQGDDYDGTANPKASWTVATDYTDGWSVTLTIRDADDVVVYTTAGTVVSSTVVAVTIAAPTSLTMTGCPGQWQGKFDVQLTKDSKKKTIALGVCYINEDQTR
jgi:hypothetical protein